VYSYRQNVAPELFLGAYENGKQLVGYVSATRCEQEFITHESMSHHTPGGQTVCIHSVCVAKFCRRKGVASRLLQEYARRLSLDASISRLALICHQELVPFYESVDFKFVKESEIVHGSLPWFEMIRSLSSSQSTFSSNDIVSALSRPRGTSQHVSYDELAPEYLSTAEQKNALDIICPRPGCGSIILKAGVGTRVVKSNSLTGDEWNASTYLPALATAPTPVQWWLIEPSPMQFENIAFSKPTGSIVPESGKVMKVLACAECETGPLGWCEQGSTEFWIVANRVHYQR